MVRRWLPAAVALTVVLIAAVLLAVNARDDDPSADQPAATPSPTLSVAPLTPETVVRPEFAALALVPHAAEYVTITDLDAIRARLGVPDLTSEDLMSDRREFWDRAEREAVLLTDGLLRADSSELWLDYDFTEDDVDWEARFTGPDGPGYVLAFRPDQDMAAVERAVEAGVGPLDGATVWADLHLLVAGVADPGDPVWASDPDLVGLVPDDEGPAETTYLRRGCIPMADALGTDATVEDQDAVLAHHDPTGLDPLPAVTLSFGDDVATPWVGQLGRRVQRDARRRPEHRPDRLPGRQPSGGGAPDAERDPALRHLQRGRPDGRADRALTSGAQRTKRSRSRASCAQKTSTSLP